MNFIKFGIYFAELEYSFDYYYKILIEYLRRIDEHDEELEEDHVLKILDILN